MVNLGGGNGSLVVLGLGLEELGEEFVESHHDVCLILIVDVLNRSNEYYDSFWWIVVVIDDDGNGENDVVCCEIVEEETVV